MVEKTKTQKRHTVDGPAAAARKRAQETAVATVVTINGRPIGRRPKVARRRQIDPTTCERDYKHDEIEFMTAMDKFKRENSRPFPTCGEVLDVLRSLGYRRDEGSKKA